ncbi:organic cation transporter protein-like [Penaeus japonicus]|uniref:organic cation transporter protein-like n=1 Tax=Penaeus japonicus TaxID=27405 RepID=UPI001C7177CA|nr:organic cation transporter protein-like [Penaeus japonicus]
MANQFDELLSSLGTGRWNILFFVASSYWSMNPVPHALGSAFFAPPAEYTCEPPEYPEGADTYNSTDKCYYLGVYNGTEGEPAPLPCNKWSYNTSTFTNTITMQFDLVCDSEYLRATYQSIYMLGTFVGEPITGILSDRYGRKTMLTCGTILFTIMAIFSSCLPNFSAILAARFILGFLHPAGLQAAYILAMETCEPRLRTVMGIILGVPWALATATWGGWAYLIRDWRWLQLAVSLPCLLILPLLWFLDESPRWLIVRGHHQRAKEVLQRAARLNRVELPPSEELEALMKNIQKESILAKEEEDHSISEKKSFATRFWKKFLNLFILLRTPRLRRISLLVYTKFFMVSMVFYGISLNAVNFNVNPFLYMALGGLMEIPAYTLTVPIVEYWGRRAPSAAFYFLSGVFILALAFVPSDLGWLVITLAMLGKFSISAGFQILYLYVTELFPTEVRLLAIGTSAIPSRIASTISPFVTDLLGPHYPWMPSVIFGIAALFAGVVTLLLHETHRMPLPDTIKELEERALTSPKDETKEVEMETKRT